MYLKLVLIFFITFINLFISSSLAAPTTTIKKHKAASWVNYYAAKTPQKIPVDEINGGVYYTLVDNQVLATDNQPAEFYSHYVELVSNQQGLEKVSQINIKFDPGYETLTLNSLQIHRNNKLINKLSGARISLLQQESELEDLIYNGQLTANIILDDVRVGDMVEYSYTIKGRNPVYNNIFSYQRKIQWSVPILQQKLRVLWGKQSPLYVTALNTKNKINKNQHGKFREYSVEINEGKKLSINNEAPNWYDPYGIVFFSELNAWADVSRWALPLYKNAIENSPELTRIANKIRLEHKDKNQQIVQALDFAQSEIRYLGIETGTNSHNPTPAGETLQRRYGDCKDKSILLISLLKLLDIPSSPALVNTETTRYLARQPPTINAFNHVLVKVMHDNKIFWLDPTRQYQNNKLSEIEQPNYNYALVVNKNTRKLEKMNNNPNNSRVIINEIFDLSEGGGESATLEIRTQYYGHDAEQLRYRLANDGLNKIQKNYLDFYRDYYSSVEPAQKLKITEVESNGSILQVEKYLLKEFWEADTDNNKYRASFYADSIVSSLAKPEQLKRNSPYSLPYPDNITHHTKVIFGSANWTFDNEESVQDNPFFYYKFTSTFDSKNKTLHLNYNFRSLTDHVAATDFNKYLAARVAARETTEFAIHELISSGDSQTHSENDTADNETAEAANEDTSDNITFIILAIYIISMIFIFINWRIDAEKQPDFESMEYYPVSMTKFFILSFVTFGFYPAYWFYRNWKYTKRIDKNAIMPIARAIFNLFWYYPLYNRLLKDSSDRFQENRVLIKPLGILFAILYFIFSLLENYDPLLLAVLITLPALLIPLVNYINHINLNCQSAYLYNSRWLFRHTLMAILVLPVIIYLSGVSLNILPDDKVVTGSSLFKSDIKYLQRKGVLPPNEKIIYFYSDAIFNTRNDGNGFTDSHVFSYWKDDDEGFQFENEALSKVQKIDITYSKDTTENTLIKITRDDDSDFLLYVSAEEELDKKFVKKLNDRWHKSRKE